MSVEAIFSYDKCDKFLSKIEYNYKDVEGFGKGFVRILKLAIYKDIVEHFEKEQASGGGKWKPHSEAYAKKFSSLGYQQILQRSGHLKGGFLLNNYRLKPGSFIWFNRAKTKKGFPYAYAHNEGGPKLPRRDFMWLSRSGMRNIEDQVVRMLQGEKINGR